MKNDTTPKTTTVRVPSEVLTVAQKEASRLGGTASKIDIIRHWIRLGLTQDPHPKALLP
jgi:hypothetical protein